MGQKVVWVWLHDGGGGRNQESQSQITHLLVSAWDLEGGISECPLRLSCDSVPGYSSQLLYSSLQYPPTVLSKEYFPLLS